MANKRKKNNKKDACIEVDGDALLNPIVLPSNSTRKTDEIATRTPKNQSSKSFKNSSSTSKKSLSTLKESSITSKDNPSTLRSRTSVTPRNSTSNAKVNSAASVSREVTREVAVQESSELVGPEDTTTSRLRHSTFRPKRVTILLLPGTRVSDEQAFLLTLHKTLREHNVLLRLGQRCRVEYLFVPVRFMVVDVQLSPACLLLETTGASRQQLYFCVAPSTELKLQASQPTKVVSYIVGYDEELKPLYQLIEGIFKKYNTNPGLMQRKHANNAILDKNRCHLISSTPSDNTETKINDALAGLVNKMQHFSLSENSENDLGRRQQNVRLDPAVSGSLPLNESASRVAYSNSCQAPDASTTGDSGVLVVAASGCGKTRLLKQLHTRYTSVQYGKSSTNLSTLFELAAIKSPCLVLLDDLDTMEHRKRLFSLLDKKPGGVVVVATATNIAKVPAELRSAGRLTLDVSLPQPGPTARRTILAEMMKHARLECAAAVLDELATKTHGATGQDLAELVQELLPRCVGQRVAEEDATGALARRQAQVTTEWRPSLGGGAPPAPSSSPPKVVVCGYARKLAVLDNCFRLSLTMVDSFESVQLPPPTRILLYGPVGCGKTCLVRAMASKYSLAVRQVTRADVFSKYFGESECNLNNIFDQAMAAVPCILHFPGFDGLAGVRSSDSHEVESRVVNLLKARMDGAIKLRGLFIVAETSRPEILDTAIVRPGRFLEYIYVGLPGLNDRLALVQHNLQQATRDQAEQLAAITQGYTVKEVMDVCREVKQQGWQNLDSIAAGVNTGTSTGMLKKYNRFKTVYGDEADEEEEWKEKGEHEGEKEQKWKDKGRNVTG